MIVYAEKLILGAGQISQFADRAKKLAEPFYTIAPVAMHGFWRYTLLKAGVKARAIVSPQWVRRNKLPGRTGTIFAIQVDIHSRQWLLEQLKGTARKVQVLE